MNTLSKAVIVNALSNDLKLPKAAAKEIVELFFDNLKEALEAGETVKLSGFGNFSLRNKAERPGRNPKTGEVAAVSARRVVTFKSGLKLKNFLKQKES